MKWITANDLADWSRRLDARAALVDMVGDLIRASVPNANHFRFPGGDKAQVRGFDGDLECDVEAPFVPAGESKWEFGVSLGVGKARGDYNKRTGATTEAVRQSNTLVLVNLHTWDSSKPDDQLDAWTRNRVREGQWRNVRYIDGAQLEHWLDLHPAVAARYARGVLRLAPPTGAQSIDEFWESYSSRYKPALTEAVLLCDREQQAAALIERLGGLAQTILYGSESADDVIAFAVAAIRSAPAETRHLLEARTIIVESTEAARFLATKQGLVYLTRGDANAHAGMLGKCGPTLSAATGVQARNAEKLVRPSATSLGKALETMGFQPEEAYQRARDCARSLTILRRLIANGPSPEPGWVAHRDALLPAVLAGGWSTGSKLDKDVLRQLAARAAYADFERGIRPTLELSDPPIDRVQEVWQTRSPIDAFPYFTHLMGEVEFERLREAALAVLSRPVHEPSADERFELNYQAPQDYSSWLRDGLANTMVLIATAPDAYGLDVPGQTPQEFVDEIIRQLPEWGRSHRSLRVLRDLLPTIAEAAPIPFLDALEVMLEGDTEIANVFSRSDGLFEPTSLHVHILFALELLAWDPALLARVGLVLARLARLDPGGKLTNRPINSLRSILLSWAPNTYATLDQRLSCIDQIVSAEPEVGWTLLAGLLPRPHDTTSPTRKPALRDVMPRHPEIITFGVVWRANTAMIARAIDQAEDVEGRLLTLIHALPSMAEVDRPKVIERLGSYLASRPFDAGRAVWDALRDLVNRHEALAEMDWTLSDEQLAPIRDIVERHSPDDPIEEFAWLFDDSILAIRRPGDLKTEAIGPARVRAIRAILAGHGADAVVRLATRTKPYLVAEAFAEIEEPVGFFRDLVELALTELHEHKGFAGMLSAIALQQHGGAWEETVRTLAETSTLDVAALARLLVHWPNSPATWQMARSLGKEVENAYWQSIGTLPAEGPTGELLYAINRFREVGRPFDVFGAAYRRLTELPGQLILSLLDESIKTINAHPQRDGTMLAYHVQRAFEILGDKTDVTMEEVARREYAYLPLLDQRKENGLLLHRFMAQTPDFYFEVFCNVFGSADEERTEPTQAERDLAHLSYELLASFHILPGTTADGVDEHALATWISDVRKAGHSTGRGDIGDQYIGRLLAHCQADPNDGIWPHSAVRRTIESLQEEQVETGIVTERYNMRGVVRRSFGEGGGQEREIAERYRRWAQGLSGCPRTVAMLNRMADDWEREAKWEDTRAEQEKLKR
ncbi:hypothetical protein [Paraburkholderia azotifigens]|uniref:Uncharacterized protein n=1 Tax=Paraburkholderia azotifigens TaxID=2057004 RepID=A0A5C6VIF9_9BURK|nr:hypothetical protein [Paraburkholderia azotifigens]TXC84491.1 hypothetical protein FRZ40_29920 [Paraburkholderia azotifigens]